MNTISIDSDSLTKTKESLDPLSDYWSSFNCLGFRLSTNKKTLRMPGFKYFANGDYQLAIEMPGIDKKDAKFVIEGPTLTVEGETGEYKYHQTLDLPKDTDVSKCVASMKNGIAKVTLPKLELQKAIQIHIQ